RPDVRDRAAQAEAHEEIGPAEVALSLDVPAPFLRLFAGEGEPGAGAPDAPQIGRSREDDVVAIAGVVAVLVLPLCEPRVSAQLKIQRADRSPDPEAENRVPGSGSELDVLVPETEAAQLEG